MTDDYITITDHYLKMEDGSVTRIRSCGDKILSVEGHFPLVLVDESWRSVPKHLLDPLRELLRKAQEPKR